MMKNVLVKYFLFAALLLITACSQLEQLEQTDDSQLDTNTKSLVIFLIRHAEKTQKKSDPELTTEGLDRANELAETFKHNRLDVIYSSDYNRTRQTAMPIANLFNLPVSLYDPGDLSSFAEKLKTLSGTVLVVGHSNTTPQLVKLLGGDPVSEIDEASEYDRLYRVKINSTDSVKSDLFRYGIRYHAE